MSAMRTATKVISCGLAALCCLSSAAGAEIQTGAAFLRIGTGARPEALGGAYTAAANDVQAMHYNPGGLGLIDQSSKRRADLGITHTQWLLDSQFDFLGFAQPTRLGTIGAAVSRLGTGSQEGRDADRRASGGFSAADTSVALGLGRDLGNGFIGHGNLSVGGAVKYLESRIGSDSASTFALDLGAMHRLDSLPMSLGLSVLNLGRGMRFISQRDPLPLTVAAGAALRLGNALNLLLDVRRNVYDRTTDVGAGAEYAVMPAFMVRAGYGSQSAKAATGSSPLGGLGGGFGIKLGNYRTDYTFTPFGELGNVQRISLGARF